MAKIPTYWGQKEPSFNIGQKVTWAKDQGKYKKEQILTVTKIEMEGQEWFVYFKELPFGGYYAERFVALQPEHN